MMKSRQFLYLFVVLLFFGPACNPRAIIAVGMAPALTNAYGVVVKEKETAWIALVRAGLISMITPAANTST